MASTKSKKKVATLPRCRGHKNSTRWERVKQAHPTGYRAQFNISGIGPKSSEKERCQK